MSAALNDLPPPPIPADADLRHFPCVNLNINDLRSSDMAIEGDPADNWFCMMLLMASWHQAPAGSLPDDDAKLAYLAGLGRDLRTWRKHKSGALRGWFLCSDGRLYHPIMVEAVQEALQKSRQQRANVKKRWERDAANSEQSIENIENQKYHGTTETIPIEGKGIEENRIEYISPPISSLRSEIAPPLCDPEGLENSESLEKPPDPPIPKAAKRPSAKRSAAKPRTRIAETWTLPPEWRDWAWGRGLNEGEIEAEAESFLNRNLRDATAYADWFAAWRTWITNCLKWRKPPGGANNDRFANRMSSRQPSATTRDSAFDQVAAEFGNPDYLPRRPAPLRA